MGIALRCVKFLLKCRRYEFGRTLFGTDAQNQETKLVAGRARRPRRHRHEGTKLSDAAGSRRARRTSTSSRKDSAQGRMIPVAPGITPGSGPGHLGLFGYDPLEFQVGRGVIEALGLGVELKPGDVCRARQFLHARRKRASSPTAAPAASRRRPARNLCALLAAKIKKIGDTEVIIKAGKEHRFVVIFRGKGLGRPADGRRPEPRRLSHSDGASARSKTTPARRRWPG